MEESVRPLARGEMLEEIGRELRWGSAYSVLFSHLMARRVGIHSTDLEAHDILTLAGPMAAGRLAALTGLTTGAVTTLIDRLEAAGLAQREPDPADRRRVIVHSLAPPPEVARLIMPEFEAMWARMEELLRHYSDDEMALILGFLRHATALAAAHVAALQGKPLPTDSRIDDRLQDG